MWRLSVPPLRFYAAIATMAVLAACNDAPQQAGPATSGEVVDGTISDDMLPYATATSQPPLMAPEPVATGSGDAASADAEDGATATPDAAESPAVPVDDDGIAEAD